MKLVVFYSKTNNVRTGLRNFIHLQFLFSVLKKWTVEGRWEFTVNEIKLGKFCEAQNIAVIVSWTPSAGGSQGDTV